MPTPPVAVQTTAAGCLSYPGRTPEAHLQRTQERLAELSRMVQAMTGLIERCEANAAPQCAIIEALRSPS